MNLLIGPASWFSSQMMAISFTILALTWSFAELSNFLISRINTHGRRVHSPAALLAGMFAAILISVFLRQINLGVISENLQYAGIILGFVGILIREYSVIALGKSFTVHVEVGKNRKLVKNGPYKFIRHPSYTGAIAILTGLTLAMGTWIGSLIAFLIAVLLFGIRINEEERAMAGEFGDDYINYKKNTYKLFPGF